MKNYILLAVVIALCLIISNLEFMWDIAPLI